MRKIYTALFLFCAWGASAQPGLTLEEAIAIALRQNFDILVSKNDAEVAHVQNTPGMAGLLPTALGNGGYNVSYNSLDQKLSNGTEINRKGALFQQQFANLTGSWRIFNGFRGVAAAGRLNALDSMGQTSLKRSMTAVIFDVINAYNNILRFKQQISAIQESVSLMSERRTLAENRWKIGTASKADFLQATIDYNEAQAQIINAEENHRDSKIALNNLLARDPQTDFNTTDSLDFVELPAREIIAAEISHSNFDIQLARTQLEVLRHQSREINAERLPTLTLNAGMGLNNSNNAAGFTLRNTTYGPTGGLGLTVPIFQGGVVKTRLRANQIEQATQNVFIEKLRNDLLTQAEQSYNSYEHAHQAYELEKTTLEAAKESAFIAMERFKKATITLVELRQAQFNLINSRNRTIEAYYKMNTALNQLLFISGRLIEKT